MNGKEMESLRGRDDGTEGVFGETPKMTRGTRVVPKVERRAGAEG